MENGNKIYKVIISDDAAQMLVSHARFLAQVSETAALQLIAEFNEKAKSLEEFPERNPWLSDPLPQIGKYRKLLPLQRNKQYCAVVVSREVVMAVRDEGTGIKPSDFEKIGTPFFTTKEQGTGLGLAVCYSIATRHNA